MQISIGVLACGELLLQGKPARLAEIAGALDRADPRNDAVLYYRENAQGEPPAEAMEVMHLIAGRSLRVKLLDQPQEVFANARKAAAGGVVIVKPDWELLALPVPPATESTAKLSAQLGAIVPADRQRSIAALANTALTTPKIEDAARAIPFLGFLIGWSQAGHRVWIFEGQRPVLAAGLSEAEFLFIDSAMLPQLQADWMAVARQAMKPGGKVFLHDREKYRLMPLSPSPEPPGWRITEPDGEASYVNCLLMTLAKGGSVSIQSGKRLPDLANLAANSEQRAWAGRLPFRYDSLHAARVIDLLLTVAAKGKPGTTPDEWILITKTASKGQEPGIQKFVFRREQNAAGTILHVCKL